MTYCEQRIFGEARLKPEQCKIALNFIGRHGIVEAKEVDIFTADAKDNIQIILFDIDRNPIYYEPERTRKTMSEMDGERVAYRTRFNPKFLAENPDMPKYLIPKGIEALPFFPPALVRKFENRENIDVLFLTEGPIKAMVASAIAGVDIVGLASITCYADRKGKLHKDIRRIIDQCHVRTVVILYDGDCRDISLKDLANKEELTRRPMSFFNALKGNREVLKDMVENIVFEHIKTDELLADKNGEKPKGIDDLINAPQYEDRLEDIIDDMTTMNRKAGDFFAKKDLKGKVNTLNKYFYLDSPEAFYTAWADFIKDGEFVFAKTTWRYSKEERKLICEIPAALKTLYRVNDIYWEDIEIPSPKNPKAKKIIRVRRQKGALIDDLGRDFVKKIQAYKTFVVVPEHVNYQKVIHGCLNSYYPLNYEPEDTDERFPHIDEMIHHIFGEQYEMGMDYMQLLYQNPRQMLPILCLVSTERETGKTTFLNFICEMFGNNAIILGNSEIQSEFNSYMGGKLVIGCDETSLSDNAKITERIKMLATAQEISINAKGQDQVMVANYAKFVFCSNNETNFIYSDENETRFWVRKVAPLKKRDEVTLGDDGKPLDFLELMAREIPAFMYYLNRRTMSVPYKHSRMWFSPDMLETDALRELKKEQRPKDIKLIEDYLVGYFDDFPEESEIEITPKQIVRMADLSPSTNYHQLVKSIERYLMVENTKRSGRTRVKYKSEATGDVIIDGGNGTVLKFQRIDFERK